MNKMKRCSFRGFERTAFFFAVLTGAGIILTLSGTLSIFHYTNMRKRGLSYVNILQGGLNNDKGLIKEHPTENHNETYRMGYSERKRPLVRVYDILSTKTSTATTVRKLELLTNWLNFKSTITMDSEAKLKCTNVMKRILWFDIWHGGSGVRNKCRKVDFSKCDCRCEVDFFTINDTEKIYDPFGGDAILFQMNKLGDLKHPPLKRNGQVFVAVEREATPKGKIPVKNYEYVFNWTMTFRKDSDIYYPYGRILSRTDVPPQKNYTDIYRRKKKAIVWFVSHCRTKSKREDYADELSKYIDLDIVGGCGKDLCPKHSRNCLPRFEEEYFFRFNFENTYHRDYVTEKLYANFGTDMIQIVGGSADYENLAPANTFINVNDFYTPQILAMFLKILMNREEMYTGYLKRKDKYLAETLDEQSQRSYCELCNMLHDPDRYRNLYYSIGDWFLS